MKHKKCTVASLHFVKYPTSSLELSVATGTFQLTLAVPRRSSVSATILSGHWIPGGSASDDTQRKTQLHVLEKREDQFGCLRLCKHLISIQQIKLQMSIQ